jgi:hypothetical protein
MLELTKANSETTRASGLVLGLLGLMAWILFMPDFALFGFGENLETTLVVLFGLTVLIAIVVASSVSLINFHRGTTASATRRLRIVSISGVTIGLLGILSWVAWTSAVMNAEAAHPPWPGAPYPSSVEVWGFLVGLVLVISISSLVLIKSIHTGAIQPPAST